MKDQYQYAERYQIQLNFLREQKNVHQSVRVRCLFCGVGVPPAGYGGVLAARRASSAHAILTSALGVRCSMFDVRRSSSFTFLTWAWMHPYERRKGHLTRSWPYLLNMFPNPHMEPPISRDDSVGREVDALQFLRKTRREVRAYRSEICKRRTTKLLRKKIKQVRLSQLNRSGLAKQWCNF